jgi:hypothetical protein
MMSRWKIPAPGPPPADASAPAQDGQGDEEERVLRAMEIRRPLADDCDAPRCVQRGGKQARPSIEPAGYQACEKGVDRTQGHDTDPGQGHRVRIPEHLSDNGERRQ